jgi:DNA-binding CsgD family transcriptional regulator
MAITVRPTHPAIVGVVNAAAQGHESMWRSAERFARLGTWCWTPATDEVTWSENLFRLIGFRPGEVEPSPELLLGRLHPEDAAAMRRELDFARAGGALPRRRIRVLLEGGGVRVLEYVQTCEESDPDGEPRRLVGFVRDVGARPSEPGTIAVAPRRGRLTGRELEVLRLAADGLSVGEIEQHLCVSHSTVKSHLEHIYEKLAVPNRAAAVARALREGLID